MRHRRWLAAAAALLLLAGCGVPEESPGDSGEVSVPSISSPETLAPGPASTEALPPGSSEAGTEQTDAAPPETEPPVTEAAPDTSTPEGETEPAEQTEAPIPTPTEGPKVLSMGLYTGPFPEDGSDEAVDSVAVLLVENASDTQLQFAEIQYLIDDREAIFRVSELPPGEKAMAVEIHRLVATPVSVWEAKPGRDIVVYLASIPEERLEIRCERDGVLTVVNHGTETGDAELYYKRRNEDGSFLGGIAYHIRVRALAPGESRDVNAAHFSADAVLVRAELRQPDTP